MKPSFQPSFSRFGAPIRTPAAVPIPDAPPVFRVGDTVMHPAEGVCVIEEIRPMTFSGTQSRAYYILKPDAFKNSSTVYMPVARGNTVLCRLLSRQDIDAIIERSRAIPPLWTADSKQRKEIFSGVLSSGDYARIIRMIQEIHSEREKRALEG